MRFRNPIPPVALPTDPNAITVYRIIEKDARNGFRVVRGAHVRQAGDSTCAVYPDAHAAYAGERSQAIRAAIVRIVPNAATPPKGWGAPAAQAGFAHVRSLAAVAILAALAACTTLAPNAQTVTLTHSAADVQSCKSVGNVTSNPPYILPGDYKIQLRNQAIGLNADTVLINGYLQMVQVHGAAYRCHS